MILLSLKRQIIPQFEFGDSGAVLQYKGKEGVPLFKIFDDNNLTIWIEKGHIKISTLIRDKFGEVVAELSANEWKVKKESVFDRNYSKNALEVRDRTGDIVLQVKIKNNRVQFQGKIYGSKGQGVAFGKTKTPGIGGIIEITGSNHPNLELKIGPIFRYPSEFHLGELL